MNLHYIYVLGRTYGEKTATPILCIHGRQDNLESFNYLLPLLPRHFYYVFIDLPNHGKSAHADKGYIIDLAWYTMTAKRVIDHFNWSKLYILGHSLGGQIGFLLAAFYPEAIMKLIIIDTLMIPSQMPFINTAKSMRDFVFDPTLKFESRSSSDLAPTYSLEEFARKMKNARMTEINEQQIRPMTERNLTKVGPDQYKYSNDQRTKIIGPVSFSFDQLESIANEICCPTLVILGKNSTNTMPLDRLSRSPLTSNRNATFKVLEGDHDIHIVHPQEVASVIIPFLSADTKSKL